MKHHFTLLVLALLVISTAVAEAQSSNAKPGFKHKYKFESIYDQSRDVTVVKVMVPLQPQNHRDYELASLTAGFYFTGKIITGSTPTFQLNLLSTALTGYKFDQERNFAVLPEKEKMPQVLGECQRVRKGPHNPGLNRPGQPTIFWFNEMLTIDLTREQFLKITEPKNVTLRFGNESFFLSTEGLEALREMAYRIAH